MSFFVKLIQSFNPKNEHMGRQKDIVIYEESDLERKDNHCKVQVRYILIML